MVQQQAHISKLWTIRLMTEENNRTDNSNQLTVTISLYCMGSRIEFLKFILCTEKNYNLHCDVLHGCIFPEFPLIFHEK